MSSDSYKTQSYLLVGLVILLTCSLPLIGNGAGAFTLFPSLSQTINRHVVYQTVTLLITLGFLWLLRHVRPLVFSEYFRKGDIAAPFKPVPALMMRPKAGQNWKQEGRDLAIVISAVTAVIIYFQVSFDQSMKVARLWSILPFSLLFAMTNAFIEECITRLGVVVALKGVIGDKALPSISAIIFGIVHYWGSPGGIAGMLAAGFLGWLLAKSILETKGIFWAWLIHFLQDVIILTALFWTD